MRPVISKPRANRGKSNQLSRSYMTEALERRTLMAILFVNSGYDNAIPGDGLVTLREAITAANNDSSTDRGDVGSGTDAISFAVGINTIALNSTLPSISTALVIVGPGSGLLTIQPAAGIESRIFNVTSAGNLSLSALTLAYGHLSADDGGAILSAGKLVVRNCVITGNSARSGGGIYSSAGSLVVRDSTIENNQASQDGGGIYTVSPTTVSGSSIGGNAAPNNGGGMYVDQSTMTIGSTSFIYNTALVGGGLFNDAAGTVNLTSSTVDSNHANHAGGLFSSGTLNLSLSTVVNNSASDGAGLVNNGRLNVNGSEFSENIAETGGGFYNNNIAAISNSSFVENRAWSNVGGGIFNNGQIQLDNSQVNGNIAGDRGGGIFNRLGSLLTGSQNQISENIASNDGGGIYNDANATVTLENCKLAGNLTYNNGGGLRNDGGSVTLSLCTLYVNSAGTGGGLYSHSGSVTMTSCTISNNGASIGGGVYIGDSATVADCTFNANQASIEGGGFYNDGVSTLTSCTFNSNSAANYGGGLFSVFSATFINCTVSGNNAALGGGLYNSGYSAQLLNTIIAGNSGSEIAGSYSAGSDCLIGGDPHLAPLGDYGGPTQTMALLPGSPAIDATGSQVPIGTDPDQRGISRVGFVDIGAFESQGFNFALVDGTTPQTTHIGQAFVNPLAISVTANNPIEPVDGGVIMFWSIVGPNGASASLSDPAVLITAGQVPNYAVPITAGQAAVTATANNSVGQYTYTASTNGTNLVFNLTNTGAFELSKPKPQTAVAGVNKTITGITIGGGVEAIVTVQLNVGHGTIIPASIASLISDPGPASNSITLVGTTEGVNAALASLIYRADPRYSGPDTLTIQVSAIDVATVNGSVAISVQSGVRSAAQQAADLKAQVGALQTARILTKGEANSLLAKLDLKGNHGDFGKVEEFIESVQKLVAIRRLNRTSADPLLRAAQELLNTLRRDEIARDPKRGHR